MSLAGDVPGLAVIGAERDPPGAELVHQRQQRVQVPGARRLADQQPHARPQPLAALLLRRRLVVRSDPGGGVRLQSAVEHARGVAVHVLRSLQAQLRELVRITGDHAREVHHLGQAQHASAAQQALQVSRGERSPRRLESRRRHARRGHEEHVQRQVGAGVGQPVHAVGAEHVCDLVGVGDHRRGAERQHQPGELVHQQHRRLEVQVRIDQAGDDVSPAGVQRVAAAVLTDAGDPAVAHGHVGLEPLAGVHRQHPAAAHDQVGRLVAACHRQPSREVGHGCEVYAFSILNTRKERELRACRPASRAIGLLVRR